MTHTDTHDQHAQHRHDATDNVGTVTDPVCGMQAAPEPDTSSQTRGEETFHFRSEGCRARFRDDLAKTYHDLMAAGKPAKPARTCLMRKLIEPANALVKADRKWQPTPARSRRIL